MILVNLRFSDQLFEELRVEGHQESEIWQEPKALICTATSMLVQNFQESLLQLVDKSGFEIHNESGYSLARRKSSFQPDIRRENILDTVVKVSLIGLKRLESQYPEQIRVNLEETRGD